MKRERLTPEARSVYGIWKGVKARCYRKTHKAFHNYGGRGITMCERWRNSAVTFAADMGPRPPGASIEREDNNGPYAPENCHWSTAYSQARNRRSNVYLELHGQRLTQEDWARRIGIAVNALKRRLRSWPLEKALTTPPLRRA